MLQVRKIREFIPRGAKEPEKFDAPMSPDIIVSYIGDLFTKTKEILEQIPPKEHWNLFYTLGHTEGKTPEERKNRTWARQDVIPFDIDDITIGPDGMHDPRYIKALSESLGVDLTKSVTMFSGNGLQILIKPNFEITDVHWFKKNSKYYLALCSKINDKLLEYGLEGEADPSAFAPNRLFRLPLTINKKPGFPEREAVCVYANLETIEWDLQVASGMPLIDESETVTEKELSYFKVDSKAVLDGCEFLKHIKVNGDSASEPEWYAADSILARLDNGSALIHEWSSTHPSYSSHAVDRKIEQSLQASGPRTCENINSYWGKCQSCKHYKKVGSPISIRGASFIATQDTGFHRLGKRGAIVPQYEDLRRYYYQRENYINCNSVHYRWQAQHYLELPDVWIENYAQEHFSPTADNKKRSEFKGLVRATNIKPQDFFTTTTNRKLNLSNGVLDIDTMELTPNDPKYGFRSILPFPFDPQAKAPTFQTMLTNVTQDDQSLQSILLEFMGYALSSDQCRADKILILTGEGQNGKSRFLNILRALGGSGVTSLGVRDLQNAFHRQGLDGALFNVMEEVPPFSDQNVWEDLKALATGSLVTASKKFKDAYNFENKAKLIMTCNSLPKGTDPTHGYYRRLLIVPFEARFSAEDGNLDVNIDQRVIDNELPGVLNMVLEGYKRLKTNEYQFSRAVAVERALEAYKLETDNVSRWACEFLALGQPEDIKGAPVWMVKTSSGEVVAVVGDMHKDYAVWADSEGERPVSNVHFARRLKMWIEAENTRSRMGIVKNLVPVKLEFKQARVGKKICRVVSGLAWFGAER